LMSWTGTETGTPTLSPTDANDWTFSLANNELTLTYVPEPASMGVLVFGLLTLAARRRGASILDFSLRSTRPRIPVKTGRKLVSTSQRNLAHPFAI